MNYKKISKKEYDIHLIKNKNFHTIDFRIFLTENMTKEKITYRNALVDILTCTTNNYDTKEKLIKKCQDLYSLRPSASVVRNGSLLITKFGISIIDSKYIEKENLEENILLLKEIILNPLLINGVFANKYFSVVKRDLELEIKTIEEDPRLYANIHLLELLDDNKNQILSGYTDSNILNNMTEKKLYESYLEMIRNSKIDIFVSGDIKDEDKLVKIITDNFIFNNNHKLLSKPYLVHSIKRDNPTIIKEKKEFQQSKLSMGFKLYELSNYENRYVSFVFNSILGGGANSLLLKLIREENSLCYYIGSFINRLDNVLIINSGINKENYDKVIDLIKESFEIMASGKFKIKDLEMAKMEILFELSNILESNRNIIDYYYGRHIFGSDDLDKRIKMIKKVSKKDIMDFSKKINFDSLFFLEGDL